MELHGLSVARDSYNVVAFLGIDRDLGLGTRDMGLGFLVG